MNSQDLSRRRFVSQMLGTGFGAAALPFVDALPFELEASKTGRALIVVFLDGGMSHIDTFDGKPEAKSDITGDLRSRRCAVDGVFVSTELPRIAGLLDRCVLVRSLTSGEGNHDRASRYLLTGRRPSAVLEDPGLGAAVIALERAEAKRRHVAIPAYVSVPDTAVGGGAGFLGSASLPFETGAQILRPGGRVRALEVPPEARRALGWLDQLDALDSRSDGASSDAERSLAELRGRARAMVYDREAREAFAVDREAPPIRERYGRHQLGRSCLLARRLVERGSRVVLVRDRGWDMHVQIAKRMTYGFPGKLPALDQAFSALIEDLERRGLHERTNVLLVSEFGRTPRVNPAGGRDHWPRVHCCVLHGAGLRRGFVLGESDARGEEPADRPVSPAELYATLAKLMRMPDDAKLWTSDGRPRRLVQEGVEPLSEILA